MREESNNIDLKAEQMMSRTHLNSKAVEVTEIENINGRKNHRWRQ